MDDTSPEIRQMIHDRMMARSGSERFLMGASMFDAARQMILASLPPNLPPDEIRRQLLIRTYGPEWEKALFP